MLRTKYLIQILTNFIYPYESLSPNKMAKIILLVLFYFHTVRVIFFEIYLWQLKEYRFDRFTAFLSTEQGKRFLLNKINIIKYLYLFFLLLFGNKLFYGYNLIILSAIYFLETILVLRHGHKSVLKLPKFTFKAVLIFT